MKGTLHITLLISLFWGMALFPQQATARKRPPKWVKARPILEQYYVGIGMAKNDTPGDAYMQVAKNNALNDLCSEISITIQSNSILRQFENNTEFTEEFEANTRTSLRQELEGYQMMGSWYNKKRKEYWVYYRLSKEKYELTKRLKLNKAKKLSQTFIQQAQQSEKEMRIHQALMYYAKALDAIKKHLDDDLSVMTFEGSKNLGSSIYNAIQNIFKNINLTPEEKTIQLEISTTARNPLRVKASWAESANLTNLPLQFNFSKGDGILSKDVNTDKQGIASSILSRVTSKQKQQQIAVSLNLKSILGDECENSKLNRLFFPPHMGPSAKINISIEPLTAYMNFEENIFGERSQRRLLENNFKKELSENFFSFTHKKEDADVILNIQTHVTKGEIKEGNNYKVYIVYLDCNISLTDTKTEMEIFNDGFQQLRGMKPISYQYAVKEAYQEAIEEIHRAIIPKLNKLEL